ncbi:hypothetical protein OG413_40180 [Streptomyces sp. NBC_01433]|uniref:hypothetical protein n=1 Tax=Streptomyces sp. NBC_01433 TaxID=2903864 RepID=UPI00225C15C0|nr:hypothetical protein [Streptomyces sp. NBC_01433]MCX4681418.1 hypothetical protein [Streptomyces sp. NBC_01433]
MSKTLETPKTTLEILRGSVEVLLAVAGQKQNQLADGIDLPTYAVSRRQSGRSPWGFDEADAIALHFGIPTLALLAGAEIACEAYASSQGSTVTQLAAAPKRTPSVAGAAPIIPAPAPTVPPEPKGSDPAPATVDDVTELSTPAPCVLCQLPATTALEGFPQHVSADECETAKEAARTQDTPPVAHAEVPHPAPSGSAQAASQPRSARVDRPARPRQQRSDTKEAGVDFLRRNIENALGEHDGDMEAAQAFLISKAIPHAMELLDITRKGGRYDVVAYPWLPEILDKPTKDKPNQIWEGRPKWSREWDTLPSGTHTIDELDINGAFLSALKTHLPLGELVHSEGPIDTVKQKKSGLHLVTPGEWTHAHLPNPLGPRDEGGPLWITEATLRLLNRAASEKYGQLCAPPQIHESWTSGSTEHLLEYVRAALTQVRADAIAQGDTVALEYIKAMYSKLVSTMGDSNYNRDLQRPDWMHIIRSAAFSNLWEKAYKANASGLHVVGVRDTDGLEVIGDWRAAADARGRRIFPEGRGVSEVKLKTQRTITIGSEA